MLEKGYILDNRYKIESVVGKGGTSVVYKAYDLNANMALRAVKEIQKTNKVKVEMARRESLLIKELFERDKYNSFFPNIIQNLESRNALYIVQDYIDGISLSRLLRSGPLPYQRVIEYAKDICAVTNFIHNYGKLHSDMKPDNIMVLSGSDSVKRDKLRKISMLKFIDFGSVIRIEDGASSYTPEYAAPEQFNAGHLDKTTDIFNIGATMYHMLTGTKPLPVSFGIKGDKKIRPSKERFVFDKGVNAELKRIILKCVNDSPLKRYRSCDDLLSDINRASNNVNFKRIIAMATASVLCIVMCCISYSMCDRSRESTVDDYLRSATNASNDSEKLSSYISALELDGTRADAYIGLIDYFCSDIDFSVSEASQLNKLINTNSEALRKDPLYEEINFKVGKLYWYYYEYGTEDNDQNESTRIIASKKWFSYSMTESYKKSSPESFQMAEIYYNIGSFYENIQHAIIEGYDSSLYSDLWENMNNMAELIDNSQTEIVLLETYKIITDLISTYTHKFSSVSGLTYKEQKDFLDKIINKTEKIEATTDKTQNIKDYITGQYGITLQKIEKAYVNKGEQI